MKARYWKRKAILLRYHKYFKLDLFILVSLNTRRIFKWNVFILSAIMDTQMFSFVYIFCVLCQTID